MKALKQACAYAGILAVLVLVIPVIALLGVVAAVLFLVYLNGVLLFQAPTITADILAGRYKGAESLAKYLAAGGIHLIYRQ